FHFHGSRHGREKIECLASAWCFVLPTYAEGMPLSILEAYAVGLPVVSTQVGGIPEMIDQGINGFLAQPGDTRAIAAGLRCVLEDGELRARISQTNRQKVFARYNISVCAEQIDEIYRELLNA
ncbi:glycosyltransferase family 4 protein, partial [candidate division KSB1 bacterium]|nr:glycosyltransferase family 4 protein [candidate division KSB1 bacterium]